MNEFVEVHSERESFRGTVEGHTPENKSATVIVMRRKQRVWLTFNGAIKTTVVMTNADTAELIGLLQAAQGA